MLKNQFFIFRLGLISLLLLAGSSCANTAMEPAPERISIATRGESLNSALIAPDPIVLPAVTPGDEEPETVIVAESVGDCLVSGNLQFESEVVLLVNQARLAAGLLELSEHALLTQVARQHSEEMVCGGFLSHVSPLSGTVEDRIETAGYDFVSLGENIAMGHESPEAVVDAWLASEGHKENLLSADYSQIGIGFAQLTEKEQTRYWTIVFAAPQNP